MRETISILVFISAYVLFVLFERKKTVVAVLASTILILSGVIPMKEVFQLVNWNVILIFLGTRIIAEVFRNSGAPTYLAEIIINRTQSKTWAILFVCLLSGFVSAFVENVSTVLVVAPVALSLSRRLNIDPRNMMIALAISSNLQGSATLIGDPPSMLLGGFAKLAFLDFFFYKGRPSIFFAVQLGAFASFIVLYFVFKRYKGGTGIIPVEKVKSWVPTMMIGLMIVSLAISSFLNPGFGFHLGLICLMFGIVSLVWEKMINKVAFSKTLSAFDWETIIFLICIFILVGSLTLCGWIDKITAFLSNIVGGNVLVGYSLVVYASVFFSAFIDNIPYLATMLPVTSGIASKLSVEPLLFLFGLLIGATLGGNITPIGAAANITSCGILKKEGYPVRFWDFMKIGLPFTLSAVTAACLFIWFLWR